MSFRTIPDSFFIRNYARMLRDSNNPLSSFRNLSALKEECGVFAIHDIEEAAIFCALGLHALQHRGQESAGIATFDGKKINVEKNAGLVGKHYNKHATIKKLPGNYAIGHVRYSTKGGGDLRNAHPLFANLSFGKVALCHNGHITNAKPLIESLSQNGIVWHTDADSEILLYLMAKYQEHGFIQSFIKAHKEIIGGYAVICMHKNKLIATRDPLGIRPMVLGKRGASYVLASETCALDIIGAKFIRPIGCGEVILIENGTIRSFYPFVKQQPRPCLFEYIYFSRPDSILAGQSVYEIRKRLGKQLALECNIKDADIIVPIPDSGVPAAIGYANETGHNFEMGITRNHYVGRTFIEPTQQIRELGVKLKHNTNSLQLKGKNVVLIDDSLVRGTTAKKIVNMVYNAGAKSVSMLISSPPIKYPDYYGIDLPNKKVLISSKYSKQQLKKIIGVKTLHFLSIDGLYIALSGKKRDKNNPLFSDHCFTGDYPTPIIEQEEKLEPLQLQLLA